MRENSQINTVKMRLLRQTKISKTLDMFQKLLHLSYLLLTSVNVSRAISGEFQKVWVLAGSTEISYKYFFCEPVIHKTFVRNGL